MASGRSKATQEKWRIFAFVGHGVPGIMDSGREKSMGTLLSPRLPLLSPELHLETAWTTSRHPPPQAAIPELRGQQRLFKSPVTLTHGLVYVIVYMNNTFLD